MAKTLNEKYSEVADLINSLPIQGWEYIDNPANASEYALKLYKATGGAYHHVIEDVINKVTYTFYYANKRVYTEINIEVLTDTSDFYSRIKTPLQLKRMINLYTKPIMEDLKERDFLEKHLELQEKRERIAQLEDELSDIES